MLPGDEAGRWRHEPEGEKREPTCDEVRAAFDEQEGTGQLSTASWAALRRLYDSLEQDPIHWGMFVCRPDAEEFYALDLEGEIPDERLDQLLEGSAAPTSDEVARWQANSVEKSSNGDGPGLFGVYAWNVADDTGRERLLVTLNVDQDSLDRVAGLFRSVDEAATFLHRYGEFEWAW